MAITTGTQLTFHAGTLAQYTAKKEASQLDANGLYFLTDTKELYIGEEKYFEPAEVVSEFPSTGAQGKLYINSATFEAKIYDGTQWIVISPAVSTTLDSDTTDSNIVTAKAVRDYIASQITEATDGAITAIAYDEASQKFTVTKADTTSSEILLKNLLTGASYDAGTGNFTFTKANGESTVINTPKENFLESASYDTDTHVLTLTLVDDTEVTVNLEDLIDTYTVADTDSIDLTLTGNEIKADVKISPAAGNALSIKSGAEAGLFVTVPDSSLIKSVTDTNSVNLEVAAETGALTAAVKLSATEGNTITENADGLFVAKTDLSNYYNKTETDSAIDTAITEAVADGGAIDNAVDALIANKADKATTLSGYGITDAYTKTEVDAKLQWQAI